MVSSIAPTSTPNAPSHSFLPRKPSLFRRDRSHGKDAGGLLSRSDTPRGSRTETPIPAIEEPEFVSRNSPRHSLASSIADLGDGLHCPVTPRTSSSSSTKDQWLVWPETRSLATNASSTRPAAIFARSRHTSYEAGATIVRETAEASTLTSEMANAASASHAVWPPRSSGTTHPNGNGSNSNNNSSSGNTLGASTTAPAAPLGIGGHTPYAVFQHIHDMSSKRISTLDYLRKAHEGRVYWFNTLLFSKADINRLSYFSQKSMSRRAANYLLLGFSLPTILDLNSNSALDYLRALNALLVEFETYQSVHPPDGSAPNSLSRGRVAGMFKRATHAASGAAKGRRQSSAAEVAAMDANDTAAPMLPTDHGDQLLPGEEYTHLMTPHLPFEPDFFETFSTLCDALIDCYTKIMGLLSGPELCGNGVGELFSKADARVRKIIVAGVVREFEDASRAGIKQEVAGVGRVVLGGLI